MDYQSAKAAVSERSYWHHSFEIAPGIRTQGNYDPSYIWNMLTMPSDLRGTRALDIGPSDGYFSMKLAQAGAEVTAVDYRAKEDHGFGIMERVSGLQFKYHQANLYDIPSLSLGKFDLVLCLGVLYHLPDMLRAIIILKGTCSDRLILETEYDPTLSPDLAVARYYEAGTLNNDITNFWVPNAKCVKDMMSDSGFRVNQQKEWGTRLLVDAIVERAANNRKIDIAYSLLR